MSDSPPRSEPVAESRPWMWSILLGLLTLVPLVVWWSRWKTLFWFGDEWELIDQIDRLGFWQWTWMMFAENFIPVFKLLWGSAAMLTGDYRVVLILLWLAHALNAMLLSRLLLSRGFGLTATVIATIAFALAPDHHETLGWTVQASAVFSVSFMLAGLLTPAGAGTAGPDERRENSVRARVLLAACSLGSAWSFARGVITGGVLALDRLMDFDDPASTTRPAWRARLVTAACALAPAVITLALVVGLSLRSRGTVATGTFGKEAVVYGLWYFLVNPFHRVLGMETLDSSIVMILGAAKIGLLGWVWRRAPAGVRRTIATLMIFDAANAVLLGYGRHHTGLPTVLSSRYQYASWLSTMPIVGWAAAWWIGRVPGGRTPRRLVSATLVLSILWILAQGWQSTTDWFCRSRGVEPRAVLQAPEDPPSDYQVPGIPGMPPERARQLLKRYDLH